MREPPKLLLVDDEQEFILTLAQRLEARGLPSSVVHCGEAALDALASDTPDLMLLDLNMPGMGGLEVLRRVNELGIETKVIVLTGHGSELEQRRADELGAFAYLNKPINIEVLSETMQRAQDLLAAQRRVEKGRIKPG